MQYSKVLLFTLLSVATANPVDYSNEDLSIYARDADADSYDLAARDAFLDDEAEAKLAIREALFDNDDDFYTALAIRQQVKRSPTKNLEKLASKHAKSAFGMNRADVEKNNKKEKKAQIWSHQHQHQVTQADGKTKIYNNHMKETKDGIAAVGAATGLARLGMRRRALIDAIYADLVDY